ncbi:HupE/UreJ family protein [Litorimonas sp. WD9-15]|uniref:HupE/UreJ family protein n=1 Tax=Litorimonas sp. WD9-15 TaxID=3418716 RepID=UPI003CFF437B
MRLLLTICLLWMSSVTAFAHEVRPAFLRATEVEPAQFQVIWKQPVLSGQRLRITPTFPEGCTQSTPRLDRTGDTVAERFTVSCDLLSGALSLPGLERTLTDAFVEVRYLNGEARTALLKPAEPVLPLEGPQASPAKDYLWIGVEHIIFGWDHLLFVIGLALLVGGRKVWGVATAFTVAHTLTLAATALGGVSLPSRPVEILIAASIVLLAAEIMAKGKGKATLGVKRPYLIAFTIGLIHGFGFAGALADIGLPQGTELLALFLFNLGVELGQFAVIGMALFALFGLLKLGKNWRKTTELVTTYAIAGIAMVWVIERLGGYWV